MPKKGAKKGGGGGGGEKGGGAGSKREAEEKDEKKIEEKKPRHSKKEDKKDSKKEERKDNKKEGKKENKKEEKTDNKNEDKTETEKAAESAEPVAEKAAEKVDAARGEEAGTGEDDGKLQDDHAERLHPVDLDIDDPATTIIEKGSHSTDSTTTIVDAADSAAASADDGGAKEINQDDIENLIDQMDDTNARQIQDENEGEANAEGGESEPTEAAKPHRTTLSGLEVLNIPGPEALRETLTNSTDPLKSIEDFQRANGILLPSLTPALPFLDLHGMDRREFHQTILNEISDKLLAKIEKLGVISRRGDQPEMADDARRKLERLLDANFPVVRVKQLQPLVLSTMKHLPSVRQEILDQVMNDAELYKASATEVKRQIWEGNQSVSDEAIECAYNAIYLFVLSLL